MGGGSDVELRGGSFSRLVVIELSSESVLLIAHVSASSLGRLVASSLMMTHNGWNSWTEFACVSRESSIELVVNVCGWEDVRRVDCWCW